MSKACVECLQVHCNCKQCKQFGVREGQQAVCALAVAAAEGEREESIVGVSAMKAKGATNKIPK